VREEIARQLWFWHSRDAEGEEHVKTFPDSTYTKLDWMELLIPEERDMWLDRADRVIALLSEKTVVDRTNPVWLRQQVAELVADCDEHITADADLASKEHDATLRARYEASADCHRHWKKQLARILTGKTAAEDLATTLWTLGI
jgi:hypothetical protein